MEFFYLEIFTTKQLHFSYKIPTRHLYMRVYLDYDISNGDSEQVALAWRKIALFWKKTNQICDYTRPNQMPQTDQIT